MKTAQIGSSVTIKFSITLSDGSVVEPAKTERPLSFEVGSNTVFRALEEGIVGMQKNESRKILVTAEQGYGHYNKDLVLRLDKKVFPVDIPLSPGKTVQYQTRDGERVNFVVNEVNEKDVTVDGNHPLAGLDLLYEVELIELS